jgi:CBS domain containing-hemolysin-like protein
MTSEPATILPKPGEASDGRAEGQRRRHRWLGQLKDRLRLGGRPSLRESIESAIEGGRGEGDGAAFSPEQREMLRRLLHFEKLRVDDVMVPRADIIAIDEAASLGELVRLFHEAGVSRIPIYRDTLDDPRGIVHIKDVFGWLLGDSAPAAAEPSRETSVLRDGRSAGEGHSAEPASDEAEAVPSASAHRSNEAVRIDMSRPVASTKLRRSVLYVPPSMPAMSLLARMQSTRNHMALVVDEYGGTDGLVTIEDLIEQIVGDIEDEHDEAEEQLVVKDAKLGLLASARAPLEEVEAILGLALAAPEQAVDIDTLGGLVVSLAGRVPVRGELVRHPSGIEFEVLDADQRRIKRLKIHRVGLKGPRAEPRPASSASSVSSGGTAGTAAATGPASATGAGS